MYHLVKKLFDFVINPITLNFLEKRLPKEKIFFIKYFLICRAVSFTVPVPDAKSNRLCDRSRRFKLLKYDFMRF